MLPRTRRDSTASVAIAVGTPIAAGDPRSAIARVARLGLTSVELDGRLAEAALGAPVPTVPLEPVPEDAAAFGLLDLEKEVLTDAYELARESFDAQLRAWRATVSLAPLAEFRQVTQSTGVAIDVLAMPGLAAWTPDQIDYICRVAHSLDARFIASDAHAGLDNVTTAARRHGLQPVAVVGPTTPVPDTARLLETDVSLAVALNVEPTGGISHPQALRLIERYRERLAYVRVGEPNPSAVALVSSIRMEAQAPCFVVVAPPRDAMAPAVAEMVGRWRHAVDG